MTERSRDMSLVDAVVVRWAIFLDRLGFIWRAEKVWDRVTTLLIYHATPIDAEGIRPAFDQRIDDFDRAGGMAEPVARNIEDD